MQMMKFGRDGPKKKKRKEPTAAKTRRTEMFSIRQRNENKNNLI